MFFGLIAPWICLRAGKIVLPPCFFFFFFISSLTPMLREPPGKCTNSHGVHAVDPGCRCLLHGGHAA